MTERFGGGRRRVATVMLGVLGTGAGFAAWGAFADGAGVAVAQVQETPAQRCERQTAEYNQAQAVLWRAAHPGEQLVGQPWPSYVCIGGPEPEPAGPPAASPAPERTHTWDGPTTDSRQYDMGLGGLGSPNTGLADRMGASTGGDAVGGVGDSARSDVSLPTPWAATVIGGDGVSRSVQVVDSARGQAVVDERGVATGEVVSVDAVTGDMVLTRVAELAGEQLASGGSGGEPAVSVGRAPRPAVSSAVVPATEGSSGQGVGEGTASVDSVGEVSTQAATLLSVPGAGVLGAGGVLAGGVGALAAGSRSRRRSVTSGSASPRATVRYPWGDEQTLFLLESPASEHTQRFDLNVPPGGRAVERADGGVDVVDADGRVVRRVDAPWAFDARGRAVATHYEIDPVTGELVQVVTPGEGVLYPIVADPNAKTAGKGAGKAKPVSVDRPGNSAPINSKPKPAARPTPQPAAKPVSRPAGGNGGVQRLSLADPTGAVSQSRPDRQVAARQPGFVGPVTQADAAGQARNRARSGEVATGGNTTDSRYQVPVAPSKNPTRTNVVTRQEAIRTDDGRWLVPHKRQDGSGVTDWTVQDDQGEHQESVAHVEWDRNGNPKNIRTIDRSEVDLPQQDRMDWANRTGTSRGDGIDNGLTNNPDGTFSDPTQGTVVPGYYNERTNQRTFDRGDGTSITEHHRGDGTQNWTEDAPGRNEQTAVSQLGWQEDGSPTGVRHIDRSTTELPPRDGADHRAWGNATQTQTPVDGEFKDENGRWHDGARRAQGYDTPVYRTEDGTLIGGRTGGDGNTRWTATNTAGERATIRELGWDKDGNPVVTKIDSFQPIDKGTNEDATRDSLIEDLKAVRSLLPIGKDGVANARQAWGELGKGVFVLADGFNPTAREEAWKAVGKDQLAWDDFARGDYDYALGRVVYNAATAYGLPAKAGVLVRGGRIAGEAADVGRSTRIAGDIVRGVDAPSENLRMRPRDVPKAEQNPGVPSTPAPEVERIDPPGPAIGPVTPAPKQPAPSREAVPDIPDSGRYTDYPNPHAVDPMMRNDLIVPPDAKPYGVGPDGVDYTPEQYAQQHLVRQPGTKYPLAYDVDGTPLVAKWNPDLEDGFAEPPAPPRPLRELEPGTIFSRIGYPGGTFFSDPGAPFPQLAMPPFNLSQPVTFYELVDTSMIDEKWAIIAGTVGPDHNQVGGAAQYVFQDLNSGAGYLNAQNLVDSGILRKLSDLEASRLLRAIFQERGYNA